MTDARNTTEEALRRALEEARAESAALRAENARLRAGAGRRRDASPEPSAVRARPQGIPLPDDHVALFRRLFRGRDDVYAVRCEAGGDAWYMPAARSSADRRAGVYLPLTDDDVRDHLLGRRTLGVYPLLRDETCCFVAADFDEASWREDAAAFAEASRAMRIPVALERSRSGQGAHAWTFFARPVLAVVARALASAALTHARERRAVALASYDRLYPSQDRLPAGGLGNLIALPLQGGPRRDGCSVFVDDAWNPYPDQWSYLRALPRMEPKDAEAIVAEAARRGAVLPVSPRFGDATVGVPPWLWSPSGRVTEPPLPAPLPEVVRVTLDSLVYLDLAGLPPAAVARLARLAAFPNPAFLEAQAMRRSTRGEPRIIHCALETAEHLGLPRGCWEDARAFLAGQGARIDLADRRVAGTPLDVVCGIPLRPAQEAAVAASLPHDIGIIHAPPGFGKTVVAAALIARRATSTLVVVPTRALLDQWRRSLAACFGDAAPSVGQLGSGVRRLTGQIDVAVLRALTAGGTVDDMVAGYGQVVIDECHHVPARTAERVLRAARARYVLGLTATPERRDGLHPIIAMQCGPVRWAPSPGEAAALRPREQRVLRRATAFRVPEGLIAEEDIAALYGALADDEERNAAIRADLLACLAAGRTPVLLTARRTHLAALAASLAPAVEHLMVLHGGMGARQRRAAQDRIAAVPAGAPMAVLATGRAIGEGFDLPRLDTLLLALPIAWHGTVEQYVGRIQRQAPGKDTVLVYDYVDEEVPLLVRMFRRRVSGYRNAGFAVEGLSGSPGRRPRGRGSPGSLPGSHAAAAPTGPPRPRPLSFPLFPPDGQA